MNVTATWGEPLLLVGEQPTEKGSTDLRSIETHTGRKLVELLNSSPREVLWAFDAENLLPKGPWSVVAAREAARDVLARNISSRLVLLGRKVAAAFGLEDAPYYERRMLRIDNLADANGDERSYWVPAVVWPHPSGRNPVLNDEEQRKLYSNSGRRLLSAWGRPLAYKPLPGGDELSEDPRADEDAAREAQQVACWTQPHEQFDHGALIRNLWRIRLTVDSMPWNAASLLRGSVPTKDSLRQMAACFDVEESYFQRPAEVEPPVTLGYGLRREVLEAALVRNELSVSEVAKHLDVSVTSVYGYLSGATEPRAWHSAKICEVFGVTVEQAYDDVFVV